MVQGVMRAWAVATVLAVLLLGACDYPEQGYFELVGLDARLNVVKRVPLQVEELVDDTEMTYGFNVLLPGDGELVEVSLANGEDKSRRYWFVAVGQGDTGLGDLVFELEHRAERLTVKGGYRIAEGEPAYEFAAFAAPEEVTGRTRLVPNGTWPPLPGELQDAGVVYFELRTITRQEFITACGGVAPEDLSRRQAAAVDLGEILPRPVEAEQDAENVPAQSDKPEGAEQGDANATPPEQPRKAPPTLGGRRGNSRK